jgi:hypothetical protein
MDKCFGKGLDLDWDTLIKSKVVEFDKVEDAKFYENCLRNSPYIGWNKYVGGDNGARGVEHTDETREKMSAAQMGNTNAMGNTHWLGRKHTDETRAKISAARKGGNGAKNSNYKGAMIGADIKTGEILHRFEGSAAAKAAGFSSCNISDVINGKRKTHKGFTWHRETIQPADSQEIKGVM